LGPEDAAQRSGRHGEPRAAHPESELACADRGLLEQVARLDQHLDRQARRQESHQVRVLRCGVTRRRDAHEVVRKDREVVGLQGLLREAREERIVFGLHVTARALELGRGDRLHRLDEVGQALAESAHGARAVLEAEGEGRRAMRRWRGQGIGIEALRAQDREHPLDARPARRGQLVRARAPPDELRHHVEVEFVAAGRGDRDAQRLGALSRRGVDIGGAQDIRELHDERVDRPAKRAGLRGVRILPGMREETHRHARIAVDHVAIELERGRGVAQHLLGAAVRSLRGPGGRGGPQPGKRPRLTLGGEHADLALQPQRVLAQPLALEAPRRHLAQHFVDDGGEGARRRHALFAARENHREVVAQPGEVAIRREEGGAQAEAVDGVDALALRAAGGEEEPLFARSVHAACFAPVAAGHTVKRSNSASRPVRMCWAVRS
jgi:hypothetical protein